MHSVRRIKTRVEMGENCRFPKTTCISSLDEVSEDNNYE